MKVAQHKPFGSEADILDRLVNERPVMNDQKAISDWNLPQFEPIYDLISKDFAKEKSKSKVNEHYYSTPPPCHEPKNPFDPKSPFHPFDPKSKFVPKSKFDPKIQFDPRSPSDPKSQPEIPKSPSTLSFTIKLKPNQKHSLQSDLNDLNKLRSQDRILSDTCTSTSTSVFEDFRKTKDFGDFQVLSNSPEKRKQPPPPVPFKPKGLKLPKMVDV